MLQIHRFFRICFYLLCALPATSQSEVELDVRIPLTDFNTLQPTSLQDFQGKVLYLDFWASWCVPCRDSFPFMNHLSEHYGANNLQVVAVNLDKDRTQALAFIADYPANFTLLLDPQNQLATALAVQGLPTAFLFDANGLLMHRFIGFNAHKARQVQAKIDALINVPTKQM